MIHKFSKSYANMWALKENLTTENENFIQKNKRLYAIYNEQPERKFCKICHGTNWRYQFHSHGVIYRCCATCGHINGSHEDTVEYCRMLYENEDAVFGGYYEDIDKEKYFSRMEIIYLPKAEFLKEVLTETAKGGGQRQQRLENFRLGRRYGTFCSGVTENRI